MMNNPKPIISNVVELENKIFHQGIELHANGKCTWHGEIIREIIQTAFDAIRAEERATWLKKVRQFAKDNYTRGFTLNDILSINLDDIQLEE